MLFLLNCFYSGLRSALYAKSRGDAGYFPPCIPVLIVTSGSRLVKLLKNSLHFEGLVTEAWSVSQISLSEMIEPWEQMNQETGCLGLSWVVLGCLPWTVLGLSSCAIFGCHLGLSWAVLGLSWTVILCCLGAVLAVLGCYLGLAIVVLCVLVLSCPLVQERILALWAATGGEDGRVSLFWICYQ